MSQEQEYQNLARRFIDLWQERMAAMMNDGDFVRMLLKMVQTAPFSGNAQSPNEQPFPGFTSYASAFSAPPAGGTTHAPDARDDAMARLERRLASIERAIAGVEATRATPRPKRKRAAKTVAKAARRPRTGKSGGSRIQKKGR